MTLKTVPCSLCKVELLELKGWAIGVGDKVVSPVCQECAEYAVKEGFVKSGPTLEQFHRWIEAPK